MLIGVMSDSHDNLPMIAAGLERLEREGARTLLHAGDFIAPFAVKAILKFPHRVIGVFGNNDGEHAGIRAIWTEVAIGARRLRLDGRNIVLIHNRDKLPSDAAQSADIIVHGHSHHAEIARENGVLRLNPGECGGWLTGVSTVALIDTQTMDARIIEICRRNKDDAVAK